MDFAHFSSLPVATGASPDAIAGNISQAQKQLLLNVMASFWAEGTKGYSGHVGKRIRITKVDIWDEEGSAKAEATSEIEVNEDMLNPHGVLHGGCIGYLVDVCSSIPLVALTITREAGGTGLSQFLSVHFQGPAPLGTQLRIVASTIVTGQRRMVSRCEGWDNRTKKLLFTAEHFKIQPGTTPKPALDARL